MALLVPEPVEFDVPGSSRCRPEVRRPVLVWANAVPHMNANACQCDRLVIGLSMQICPRQHHAAAFCPATGRENLFMNPIARGAEQAGALRTDAITDQERRNRGSE